MNIVHVFPYSPFVSGGHSNAIAGFLRAQLNLDIEVVGIAPQPPQNYPTTAYPLPFRLEEYDSSATPDWKWIEDRFGFDPEETVVHIHTIGRNLSPLLKSLRHHKVPYVMTSHGQLHFRSLAHWAKKFIYLNLLNRDIRKADAIHFLTTDAQHRARRLLPGYAGKCFVQAHSLDLPDLTNSIALNRSDFQIPQDAFIWMFLGRLDVHVKGLDLLLEAFALLNSKRNWLVFAGPDWAGGKAHLEELAQRSQCADRIRFTGPVYGENKWAAFKMSDGFVSPSRWDAFPVSVLEAMACGLPIVTSDRMGPATDFCQAGAALVCTLDPIDIASKMSLVTDDSELKMRLNHQGRTWVKENCSPHQVGLRFQKIYRLLV